ncbi:hypothetical protein Dvar_23940 [Desulfosarcina variabilis str. Montpellier]|uniref:SidJ-related pseudokinase n=1 Tax=Desulfosarcina variabilis TaxID=2300 RepID=UPI003AFA137A
MSAYPTTLKQQAENALVDSNFDFIAKYHAVTDLRRLLKKTPHVLDRQTIAAVTTLLQSDQFHRVRQSYFLFREAAKVISDMIVRPAGNGMGQAALATMEGLLSQTHGSAHRGVAEALGSLPLVVKGPRMPDIDIASPPSVTLDDLARAHGLRLIGDFRFIGRSLVAQTSPNNRLLVAKLAKTDDCAADLSQEIRWMEALQHPIYDVDRRFHIPAPLTFNTEPVVRLTQLPIKPPGTIARHPQELAIVFVTQKDYFVYPNDHRVSGETALEILSRNAYLMGFLAAKGIIHDAPIPLFHNRTQRLRRDDQGRYQWFRAGRLDQWLDSCAFPNLGLSGLRDFEHLISFEGTSRLLYRHIGSHFFSLLLVAGSYFRSQDGCRRGLDADGRPVDARDLFDPSLLARMIHGIFDNYYAGFCGTSSPTAGLPIDHHRLVARMIEEMGVDRYMSELLRRVDQQHMTPAQFHAFLRQKGYDAQSIEGMQPGQSDILITSGPHLGDFNRQISLPELVEAVAAMSAVCIAGRYMAQNGVRAFPAPY